MLKISEIIDKKERNCELSEREIELVVDGYTRGEISDRSMGSFLRAVYHKGMTLTETVALTRAMVNSGEMVDLSHIPGAKVDKHSTGGVGDKTTLVVAPLVAASGVNVVKMAGRALGHTGGTIDKLESIPRFNVHLTKDAFVSQIERIGIAISAQTADLVPADKKIYELRNKTGTIASIPLIASSVMCKKIAAGADAIVLEVTMGSGAFMKTFEKAKELAEVCVSIGKVMEKTTVAVIANMNQPLGRAVGDALEVREVIETLKARGPHDLTELSLTLGCHMLVLAGQALTHEEAREILTAELESGNGLDKLAELVEAQGGDRSVIDEPDRLLKAKLVEGFTAERDGYISAMDTEQVGWIAKDLVGLVFQRKIGDDAKRGDVICEIHANTLDEVEAARRALSKVITISDRALPEPLIYSVIRG